jgi:hypothetical protein
VFEYYDRRFFFAEALADCTILEDSNDIGIENVL